MHISKRATDVSQPGLGPDLVFRDPWSRAYNISLDYDYDDMCRDSIYSLEKVSSSSTTDKQAGFNGLTRPSGLGDTFILRAPVMIWSSGPDRGIDPTTSANLSSNKDNILSWTR